MLKFGLAFGMGHQLCRARFRKILRLFQAGFWPVPNNSTSPQPNILEHNAEKYVSQDATKQRTLFEEPWKYVNM